MRTNIELDDLNEQGKQKILNHYGVDSLEDLNPSTFKVAVLEE